MKLYYHDLKFSKYLIDLKKKLYLTCRRDRTGPHGERSLQYCEGNHN